MLVATAYSGHFGLDSPLRAEELQIDHAFTDSAPSLACLPQACDGETSEAAWADAGAPSPRGCAELELEPPSELARALTHVRRARALSVERATGGTSEVLFVGAGEAAIVFKPADADEKALRAARHERAAFLLDRGWAGVPETALATLRLAPDARARTGSAQLRVRGEDASDYGANTHAVEDVHRVGVLDARILNRDRHAGNLLLPAARRGLVPIDHALAFPSVPRGELADVSSEVFWYPQAKQPFSAATRAHIARIDVARDVELLEAAGVEDGAVLGVWMSTTLLQRAAARGKTLFEIGRMLVREGDRSQPSALERLCQEALAAQPRDFFAAFVDGVDRALA